jgi:hypothetical protein
MTILTDFYSILESEVRRAALITRFAIDEIHGLSTCVVKALINENKSNFEQLKSSKRRVGKVQEHQGLKFYGN